MKYIVMLIAGLTLNACGFTSFGDSVREGVQAQGAQAYDEGLANSEFFICQAASVGSIKRRYGKDKEAAEAWKTLCDGDEGVDLITPAE